jgi:hypothetical protein
MPVMRHWISRLLIALVTAWNLQAAFQFILFPKPLVSGYELSGAAGEAAMRGVGVLFLMWNIPYLFALLHPIRFRLALILSLLMQFTGLLGEIYILSTLTVDHVILRASILRFIAFDGTGLVLLLLAWLLIWKQSPSASEGKEKAAEDGGLSGA